MTFVDGLFRALPIVVGVLAVLLAAGAIWEGVASRADAKRVPLPGRLVHIGDGRRLHLRSKGDAPGPTVVLEMGLAETSPYWWAVQDEVAKFARVCTYDRCGYGWSDADTAPVTLEGRAADLRAVLAEGQIPGPYVLVGHSLGGPLIRLFARDHRNDVAGLVFVDTPDEVTMFGKAWLDYNLTRMTRMLKSLRVVRRLGLLRAYALVAGRGPFDPQRADRATLDAIAGARRPSMYAAALAEIDAILSAPERLRREYGFCGAVGDTPVAVVMHGKAFPPPFDVLESGFAESQQRLAALSTNSVVITASHAGHAIQEDEPEVVVEAIRRVVVAARDRSPLVRV